MHFVGPRLVLNCEGPGHRKSNRKLTRVVKQLHTVITHEYVTNFSILLLASRSKARVRLTPAPAHPGLSQALIAYVRVRVVRVDTVLVP